MLNRWKIRKKERRARKKDKEKVKKREVKKAAL